MNLEKKKNTVSPNYTISSDYKQFNAQNMIFERVKWDRNFFAFKKPFRYTVKEVMDKNQDGYSRIDYAASFASWTIDEQFRQAFSSDRIDTENNFFDNNLAKFPINEINIEKVTLQVKNYIKLFGGSLVGIAPIDKRWIYSLSRKGKPINIPENMHTVISIAIEMDAEHFATTPSAIHGTANGYGYSMMGVVVACSAEFIRNLGYDVIACGNDTALSIPIAIDAGLGQLGRNGLLITKEFGSRVKLVKIFTNMPLKYDEPKDFGVTDFCKTCFKCANTCEVEAISKEVEPSFKVHNNSNNKGVLRWAVNAEKCYEYWLENGSECSTCIVVCPYNLKGGGKKQIDSKEFWDRILKK